jgi:ATP-binding cassette subfamily B protein
MDRLAAFFSVAPRGWLLLGLVGLAPVVLRGPALTADIAVALGGVLLAFRAYRRFALGLDAAGGLLVAWRAISPLFRAGARAPADGSPRFAVRARAETREARPVADARDVVFRYREKGEAVLRGVNLRITGGERILLEGGSGGGKSTFASILAGVRTPESGLVLVGGLDLATLGPREWRRQIVATPQFHENHVLTSTFAFNLLMGRRWPPEPRDIADAEAVCAELGLDGLLARMPSGLGQTVGETGWQLSHGERSRLYIARALLQDAELIVLDESFAALDPESLRAALACVRARAKTLLVIAHP